VKKKVKAKKYQASRKFVMRVDATVASGTREIERVFGLPQRSVRLELPNGRRARGDKRIGALLRGWEEDEL
jgi:hypothetical protein